MNEKKKQFSFPSFFSFSHPIDDYVMLSYEKCVEKRERESSRDDALEK